MRTSFGWVVKLKIDRLMAMLAIAASLMLAGCACAHPILHAEVGIPRDGVAIRWARAYKADSGILFRAKLVRASRRSRRNVDGRLSVQMRWTDGSVESVVSQSRCLVRRPTLCDLALPERSAVELVWAKAAFERVH